MNTSAASSPRPIQLDSICTAALGCFTVNGFHGTSIRQIASAAGLSVPGIYHHYPSKDAILVRLGELAMDSLLTGMRRSARVEGSVEHRFELLVACMLRFHAEFQDIAFVTFSEMRSLPHGARDAHVASRREAQHLLTSTVEEGCASGVFSTAHPRHAARAITNICMGVSQWYRADGDLQVDSLVSIYTQICGEAVGLVRA